MELNIIFLSVLKYKDKETGKEKIRFSYLLNDEKAKRNDNTLKGLSELSFYSDSTLPFEKLSGDDALQPMILIVEQKPSVSNPLKQISQVTAIQTKNEIINLF